MERSTLHLPHNYQEIYKLDLQKDKKPALIVNVAAVLFMLVLLLIGNSIVPVFTLFEMSGAPQIIFVKIGIAFAGVIVYMLLHELVHGIAMKYFGASKIKYGFTGLYAYAGCDAYFPKGAYLVIALAPIAVWGIVLLILNCIVPATWFWVVYFIQVNNLSGAAGDLYVTYKFLRFPKDILVQDAGVSMRVYSASSNTVQ